MVIVDTLLTVSLCTVWYGMLHGAEMAEKHRLIPRSMDPPNVDALCELVYN